MHLLGENGKCILPVAHPGVSPGTGHAIMRTERSETAGKEGKPTPEIIDVHVREQIESSRTASTPRELHREETGHDS
jgi:hypothetical protein